MKSVKTLAAALLLPAVMMAKPGIEIKKTDHEVLHIAGDALASITYSDGCAVLTSVDGVTVSVDSASSPISVPSMRWQPSTA